MTKLDIGKNSNEYKVKPLWNSVIYTKQLVDHLLKLYYMIF